MDSSHSRAMLFLVVDAVPYELAIQVWREGGLPGFDRPRPMISVFPSLTNVAVPALVRPVFHQVPPGYEALYYHPPSGEIRGGLGDPSAEEAMAPFHLRPKGPLGHTVIYVLRRGLAMGQIRWVKWQFQQNNGPWLGWLTATDGVGHFGGREAQRRTLIDIGQTIAAAREQLYRETGVMPGAVLTSDHGLVFNELKHLDETTLAELLRTAGFQPGKSRGDGVMLCPMGDVGAGAAWCELDRAVEVAEVVSEAPGVDLAVARTDRGCRIFAVRPGGLQIADVEWRRGRTRYLPIEGDPIHYGEVTRALGGQDGWIDDDDLFRATWDHTYPYALPRLRDALTDAVQFPAQVLFSMEEGYTFGPMLTHQGARLMGGQVGGHGALTRGQSTGFSACTDKGVYTGPLRPHEVFAPWADLVRQGSAIQAHDQTYKRLE